MADENTPEPEQPVQEAPAAPEAAPESPSQASINHEIRRLTRDNAETKQVNAALIAAMEAAGRPQQPQPTPPTDDGPPKREQFPDDFAFFEARQDHAFKDIERKSAEAAERAVQSTRQRFHEEQRDQALRQSYNKGLQKHPDFDIVVRESATTISDPMVQMIMEHDEPEDVYYWLAQSEHKAEAARIATLSPARAAHEIGKIADQIKAKVPETMEPMKPLSGGGSPAPSLYDTTRPSSDRLSDDEWFRRENERERAKRAG